MKDTTYTVTPATPVPPDYTMVTDIYGNLVQFVGKEIITCRETQ